MPEPKIASTVRKTLRAHSEMLWRYPNVIGTAVGFRQRDGKYTDEVVIQVYVSRKLPQSKLRYPAMIPPSISGPDGEPIPTDVFEAGFFRPTNGDPGRYRPVEGGAVLDPSVKVWQIRRGRSAAGRGTTLTSRLCY